MFANSEEWKVKAHIVPFRKETRVKVGPWMAFKMLFPGYIKPVVQLEVKKVVEEYNNPSVTDPSAALVDVGEGMRKPRHSNKNWYAAYSLLAHAQFHSPRFTRANEMVVSTWIRKAMEADGIRRVDIASVLPMAVRIAFVPTDMDAMAVMVDNTPVVRRAHKARDMKYWSNWFGLRRSHYESDC